MGGGASKDAPAPESRAVKSLLKCLRKGTMHLEISMEDALAFEKLRQQIYESENPLTISVFDLALFISMSMVDCCRGGSLVQRLVGSALLLC